MKSTSDSFLHLNINVFCPLKLECKTWNEVVVGWKDFFIQDHG